MHEGKSAKQTLVLRALDVGGVSSECFLRMMNYCNSSKASCRRPWRIRAANGRLPLDEEKEDANPWPFVQLGALQLLVSRSEALSRNDS